MKPFFFAAAPHIHFGCSSRNQIVELVRAYGERVLLVTGHHSFDTSLLCKQVLHDLEQTCEVRRIRVSGEPSPSLVDDAVSMFRPFNADVVLAIGGGSAVDAAKAIAGLLLSGDSVLEYLEGVGRGRAYQGPSLPFIAVPTTAGTGGETSKNAVLSEIGEKGYKKSFRHETLVARHIVLDPELTLECPPKITAACGMDAFTQLLESYVSINANPVSDALALSGLKAVRSGLINAVEQGRNIEARSNMLYASSISGLTLANAGLGSVHGLASPLGAFFPIPHGEVCGSLLADATRINIEAMEARAPDSEGLCRYADAARLMLDNTSLDDTEARQKLLELLYAWTERMQMPRLSDYGVQESDVDRIVVNSRGNSMKTNPIELTDDEVASLIRARL